jgi:hypothetical protein
METFYFLRKANQEDEDPLSDGLGGCPVDHFVNDDRCDTMGISDIDEKVSENPI